MDYGQALLSFWNTSLQSCVLLKLEFVILIRKYVEKALFFLSKPVLNYMYSSGITFCCSNKVLLGEALLCSWKSSIQLCVLLKYHTESISFEFGNRNSEFGTAVIGAKKKEKGG